MDKSGHVRKGSEMFDSIPVQQEYATASIERKQENTVANESGLVSNNQLTSQHQAAPE